MSHSSWVTAKVVDLAIARDGFPSPVTEIVIVVILIAEMLYNQFLFCLLCNGLR